MNNRALIFLSMFLAVIAVIFNMSAKKQPADDEAKMFEFMNQPLQWRGKPAPDFTIDCLDNEKFIFSEHVGKKVVILNFFATWCNPCKEEMPELVRFYEMHRKAPVIFIGINADESEDAVSRFIRDFNVTYPVAIDKKNKLQKLFSVRSFPTTIFIGADGVVHIYEVGQIKNADIAFDEPLKVGLETIKAGVGITKEGFFARLEVEKKKNAAETESRANEESTDPLITGRAKTIAEKMRCPCGCSHTVMDCTCSTAKNIKEQLKKRDISNMTDADVIKSLNQEFCMK